MADVERHVTALKTVSANTGRGIKSNARTTRVYTELYKSMLRVYKYFSHTIFIVNTIYVTVCRHHIHYFLNLFTS